jgi:class 3 adenylate cyclase
VTTASPARSNTIQGTVMFTDIVGFTEFNALRGDDEALELLALQERIVREEISDDDARIVKELGDGLMLWFGDPCVAVQTGLRLQERFEEESWRSDTPLWVRIGIHHGRQTTRGQDLIGHDVNIASRIMDFADTGEVLASEATVDNTHGAVQGVEFQRLGPVVMKGLPDPINLFRAERAG